MSLLCSRLLETVLGYINAVAQSMERNADKLTGKFWRALLSKAYDMLDKVGEAIQRIQEGRKIRESSLQAGSLK